jgi:uncharacterized protein (TIGR04255 family)
MPGLIYDELKEAFPKREPARVLVGVTERVDIGTSHSDAINFLTEDERVTVLVGPSILSINHLDPYPSWESFLPMIKQGFEAYMKVVRPENLRGIELRYINEIKFHGGHESIEYYFNLRPVAEKEMPQDIGSFISGIQVPYENTDSLRIELQGASNSEEAITRTVLDLDYVLTEFDSTNLEEVFSRVENAHARIEEAFEASVTDQSRAMFSEEGH